MELEVYWSGALERAGLVKGLSCYRGRSSLYHAESPWHLACGEAKEQRPKGPQPKALTDEQRVAVKSYLRAGWTLRAVAVKVGVTFRQARRCRTMLLEGTA